MKVYIFNVDWDFSDGMAIAITNSYERACELIQNTDKYSKFTFHESYKTKPKNRSQITYDIYLIKTINTDEIEEWAEINYNYA